MSDTDFYIGLMSGTSMDAIDAAVVVFDEHSCRVVQTGSTAYPDDLATRLRRAAMHPARVDPDEVGTLDMLVARSFAAAAQSVMAAANVTPQQVAAIGSHGQTILHRPDADPPFSLQLGNPALLAALTGTAVVADFRSADIALGGQGAPLVPAFHRWAFGKSSEIRAVVNIGGIANVTRIDPDGETTGFDTGPGNVLLDQWHRKQRGPAYDNAGRWAAGGTVDPALLARLRADSYFARTPPKSTGTDYFNLDWLLDRLGHHHANPDPCDVQATLSELTASTIADAIGDAHAVAVCGGGVFNTDLLNRLERKLQPRRVDSTAAWGIDPAWVEAVAFAWLARKRLRGEPSNLPAVTGARAAVSLGGIFLPPID